MSTPTPLAAPGGLTYGEVKTTLARVVDNGVCDDDPRVLERTNEATKLLLDALIPVGGMATYDIIADGTTLLLPPELENAIETEVRGSGLVNNESDVRGGWYDLVNQFTYVDPDMQHDSPLVDQFLHPDPTNASILRRQYDFPGLSQGATVRVTGAKRYVPISSDNDYLIIQNIRALKMAIMSLERSDINDPDNGAKYYSAAIGMLKAEVTKHLLDPRNSLKRRAQYEKDFALFPTNSFGWVRARMALEIPKILMKGKSEITGMMEMAEMRLISKGLWKGTVEEFHATAVDGLIKLPLRVDAVLMARLDGFPIDVRSIFFGYMKNGPGHLQHLIDRCHAMLSDEGEVYDPTTDTIRRQYRLKGACPLGSCLSMACKLRWVKKDPSEQMVIKNFEAMRLMTTAIDLEENEKWQEAAAAAGNAVNEVEKETREYIGGQEMVPHVVMMPGRYDFQAGGIWGEVL